MPYPAAIPASIRSHLPAPAGARDPNARENVAMAVLMPAAVSLAGMRSSTGRESPLSGISSLLI
jgi:hypothetical protein